MTMPADERATARQIAEHFMAAATLDEAVVVIEQALKEADRLAREDAARIVDRLYGGTTVGERLVAAIRASITTDEGEAAQ